MNLVDHISEEMPLKEYPLRKVCHKCVSTFGACLVAIGYTGKQAPQRDFSQFSFQNSEPKIEGDDSSSIGRS